MQVPAARDIITARVERPVEPPCFLCSEILCDVIVLFQEEPVFREQVSLLAVLSEEIHDQHVILPIRRYEPVPALVTRRIGWQRLRPRYFSQCMLVHSISPQTYRTVTSALQSGRSSSVFSVSSLYFPSSTPHPLRVPWSMEAERVQ